jgi:hypothetical protein
MRAMSFATLGFSAMQTIMIFFLFWDAKLEKNDE